MALGNLDEIVPQLGLGSSMNYLLYGLLILVVVIIFVITGYFLWVMWKFNRKVIIWEKIGDNWEIIKKDRGMFMKIGTAGDQVFYLKKLKMYLPTPKIQASKGTYWYFKRNDNELINWKMKDLDEESKAMGAHFVDADVRYARVALEEKLKERFTKKNWLEKYGALIGTVLIIILLLVFVFLIIDKVLSSASTLNQALKLTAELQRENAKIVGLLDQLYSNTGIRPT